ncbi:hypothetical protein ABGB17_04305 [Sphaerisporangium sp. B11E5]|uniref:hypothetical protein n=1 Tax=Sphaerisporangium sp. B11E5 TaxID=3153563 RepID=UPI00325E5F86
MGIAPPCAGAVPAGRLTPGLRDRAATAGVRHREVVFEFHLDRLPPDRHYARVRFEVRLAGGVIALRLGAAPVACLPLAETPRGRYHRAASRIRGTGPAPRVFGVLRPAFGFTVGEDTDRPLPGRSYRLRALLELPPGVPDVVGAMTVGAAVARGGALLGVAPATAEPFRAGDSAPAGDPPVRLCVAACADPYGNDHRAVELLTAACGDTGLRPSAVEVRDGGGGWFAVLPAGTAEAPAGHGLVGALLRELRRRNTAGPALRLRLAVCRGVVPQCDVSAAAAALHRELDSPPVRSALADEPDACLAVALSASLYAGLAPYATTFRPTAATLPEKGFEETAWLMLA